MDWDPLLRYQKVQNKFKAIPCYLACHTPVPALAHHERSFIMSLPLHSRVPTPLTSDIVAQTPPILAHNLWGAPQEGLTRQNGEQ